MDLMDLSGRVPPAASVPAQPGSSGRRTLVLVVLALIMTAVLARVVAERALVDSPGPWIGPLQLHLTYNSGVAFSMGNTLPRWLVTAGTSAITLLVAVYAWRSAPIMPPVGRLGLAAVLAGALSNVIDRAVDGVVTDYLHTGWFPTFNLPDVYITCGAVLIVAGALFSRPAETGADTTTNSTDDR